MQSAALVLAATVLCTTDAFTGCTVSARGSRTFKGTQTTGTLDVKELPDPQIEDHRRGLRLAIVSDKVGQYLPSATFGTYSLRLVDVNFQQLGV